MRFGLQTAKKFGLNRDMVLFPRFATALAARSPLSMITKNTHIKQ